MAQQARQTSMQIAPRQPPHTRSAIASIHVRSGGKEDVLQERTFFSPSRHGLQVLEHHSGTRDPKQTSGRLTASRAKRLQDGAGDGTRKH